jgi:hypothetical protein
MYHNWRGGWGMNWEAIGAVGEILGAIAVVTTLFYLAVQIRHSTRLSRADMSKELFMATRAATLEIASNPELGKVMAQIRGQDVETHRQDMAYQSFFRLYEIVVTLYDQGFVDDGIYRSYVATIRMFCGTEPFEEYWQRNRNTFQDDFREFVETQLEEVKRDI